ncbi:hypothetical protein ARAM_003427 [Aspergillus rambellii]|uniref:Allergen Asp f 15 n=2 Tax=Aspergillus subgen. Nidulantes TaxID=2720870 RepID=A0A0F8XK81_9EURO|nr:hypothetical protein AOCH_004448 [Aspergillus ochraceoroseus]KKK23962.1 hypothetical protein ARAM_003427 [Aspergillus rambellii]
MKFTAVLSLLPLLLTSSLAAPVEVEIEERAAAAASTVSWDAKFDVAGSSMTTVACSDGTNGLMTKGYSTFGSLPSFPRIGGAPTIPGWNSPQCGACYSLEYNGRSIYITAIDAAPGGFNIGMTAMNTLTNGQAEALGRVPVTYTQVDRSLCGF